MWWCSATPPHNEPYILGRTSARSHPRRVRGPENVGYLGGVTAIAGGELHTLAIRKNGSLVWAWGYYGTGQVGNGAVGDGEYTTPIQSWIGNVGPREGFSVGRAMGTVNVPVTLSWRTADTLSTTQYQLQQSTDGGIWTSVSLPSLTATSVTRYLAPAHSYRFRKRQIDPSGSVSGWSYGRVFRVEVYQEDSGKLLYSDGWTQQSLRGAYGGAVRYGTLGLGEHHMLTSFHAGSVAWVSTRGPNRGKAEVSTNGRAWVIDLYSDSERVRRIVFAQHYYQPAVSYGLRIVVLGAQGRPRVDVDAIVLLK